MVTGMDLASPRLIVTEDEIEQMLKYMICLLQKRKGLINTTPDQNIEERFRRKK